MMETKSKFQQTLALVEAGEYERALKEFHELAEETSDKESKLDCLFGELLALTRLERTGQARTLLQAARQMFGDIDESHARGDLIEVQIDSVEGKWDDALNLLQKMAKRYRDMLLHPQLRDVYEEVQWRRGMLLTSLGQFREALPLLEESVHFIPPYMAAELHCRLGLCYVDAGDRKRATEAFTKALELGLDEAATSTARFNLGIILMKKEAYAKAIEELRAAEAHADAAKISKEQIHKALAVSYGKLGMLNEARQYAQRAGVSLP
jgi:tetratricopeptide (TPR) repeat protein